MDNINFTGSFVIKKPGKVGWKKIMNEMIPESAFIKGNFLGKGNMFLATSDRFDREVATYLTMAKHDFTYYPEVNLKSGVCNLPQNLIEAMIQEAKAITKQVEILKHATQVENKYIPDKYVRKPNDHLAQTISALKEVEHIPADKLKYYNKNGVTVFVDQAGRTVAKASPNNPRGHNFIVVFPRYGEECMEIIKANYTGETEYRRHDVKKFREFKRDFIAAVQSWKNNSNI